MDITPCAILKEPVTPLRWIATALAFAGLLIIFGVDIGVPWPRNFGDWLGLMSGMAWAAAAVRLNMDRTNHPIEHTLGFVTFGALICVLVALLPIAGNAPAPSPSTTASALIWLIPVVTIIVLPSAYATMWGARLIDPGIVGLLFMTEIIVGTITVAIWAGEPFGLREITGVILITMAGALESLWELYRRKQPKSG